MTTLTDSPRKITARGAQTNSIKSLESSHHKNWLKVWLGNGKVIHTNVTWLDFIRQHIKISYVINRLNDLIFHNRIKRLSFQLQLANIFMDISVMMCRESDPNHCNSKHKNSKCCVVNEIQLIISESHYGLSFGKHIMFIWCEFHTCCGSNRSDANRNTCSNISFALMHDSETLTRNNEESKIKIITKYLNFLQGKRAEAKGKKGVGRV